MKPEETNFNIEANFAPGEAQKLLVIRFDNPAKDYDPERINIAGTIRTPSEFYNKRSDIIDPKKGYVEFSKEQRKITLILNSENKFFAKIEGKLKMSAFLNSLHINDGDHPYSLPGLRKTLKNKRMYFDDKATYKPLMLALQNYTATVEKTIQEWKEDTKQKATGVKIERKLSQAAEEFKFDFVLSVPIFEGGEKIKIPITVVVEPGETGVELFLEYDDLDEKIEDEIDRIFVEEAEHFKEFAIIEKD